jgi:predicted acyl esterase
MRASPFEINKPKHPSSNMARGQPAGDIKVKVSRHNAQLINSKLCAEVEAIAKSDHVRTDIHPASQRPSQEFAHAIVSTLCKCEALMTTTRFLTGECIRVEFTSHDCSRRKRTPMGRWNSTVGFHLSSV